MSGKIITAIAAAVLLASTALASAQSVAPHRDRQKSDAYSQRYNGYYNMAPNGHATPNDGRITDPNPFPVTGQSGA